MESQRIYIYIYIYIYETQTTEIQYNLSETIQNHNFKQKIKINQKLNYLYQGTVFVSNTHNKYINLLHSKLTETQREIVNLGPNWNLSRIRAYYKRTKIEILCNQIQDLQNNGNIPIQQTFATY